MGSALNGLKESRAICMAVFFMEVVAYPLWTDPEGIHFARVLIATASVGWMLFDIAFFLEEKEKKNE
jgi:hypothetical protein